MSNRILLEKINMLKLKVSSAKTVQRMLDTIKTQPRITKALMVKVFKTLAVCKVEQMSKQ